MAFIQWPPQVEQTKKGQDLLECSMEPNAYSHVSKRPSDLRARHREEMGRNAAVNVEITGQRMSEPRSFFFPLSFSVSRSVSTQEMRKAAASPPPALCWTSPPPSLKAWSCTSTPQELYSKQAAWKTVNIGNDHKQGQTNHTKQLKSTFGSESFGG